MLPRCRPTYKLSTEQLYDALVGNGVIKEQQTIGLDKLALLNLVVTQKDKNSNKIIHFDKPLDVKCWRVISQQVKFSLSNQTDCGGYWESIRIDTRRFEKMSWQADNTTGLKGVPVYPWHRVWSNHPSYCCGSLQELETTYFQLNLNHHHWPWNCFCCVEDKNDDDEGGGTGGTGGTGGGRGTGGTGGTGGGGGTGGTGGGGGTGGTGGGVPGPLAGNDSSSSEGNSIDEDQPNDSNSEDNIVDILTAKLAYSLGFMLHSSSVVLIILSRSSLPSVDLDT